MSACICRMPLAAEVDTFQRKIRGDQRFVASRNLKHSGIISNTVQHARESWTTIGLRCLRGASDARDEL